MAPTQNNRIAMVYCAGGSRAKRRGEADLSYLDCSMAKQAFADGVLECAQGCLGLGSCVEACRLDAITLEPTAPPWWTGRPVWAAACAWRPVPRV